MTSSADAFLLQIAACEESNCDPLPANHSSFYKTISPGIKTKYFFQKKFVSLWGPRVAHPIRKLRIGRKGQVDDDF
jgi:hypothetical protein